MRAIRAGSLKELIGRTAGLDPDEYTIRHHRTESHAEMRARQTPKPSKPRSTAQRLKDAITEVRNRKRDLEGLGSPIAKHAFKALYKARKLINEGKPGFALRHLEGWIAWHDEYCTRATSDASRAS